MTPFRTQVALPTLAVLSLITAWLTERIAVTGTAPDRVAARLLRTDAQDDPLLPGALVRLGSTRFRPGRDTRILAFSGDGKLLASGHPDALLDPCWPG